MGRMIQGAAQARVRKGALWTARCLLGFFGVSLGAITGWAVLWGFGRQGAVRAAVQAGIRSHSDIPTRAIQGDILTAFEKAEFHQTILQPSLNRADPDAIQAFRHAAYCDDAGRRMTVEASVNDDGFRGRTVALTKPTGTTRVVVVGDSHTFGFALEDEETFPAQLERLLNQSTGRTFDVLNLGCPGINLMEKLDLLRIKGLKYHPDMVILQYNGDDLFPKPFREWETHTLYDILRARHLSDLKDQAAVRPLFGEARGRLITTIGLNSLEQNMLKRPVQELVQLGRDHHFQTVIIGTWVDQREQEALIKDVAARAGIRYLNVESEIFKGRSYAISRYEPHFGKEGQALIAQRLSRLILQQMSPQPHYASRQSPTAQGQLR